MKHKITSDLQPRYKTESNIFSMSDNCDDHTFMPYKLRQFSNKNITCSSTKNEKECK